MSAGGFRARCVVYSLEKLKVISLFVSIIALGLPLPGSADCSINAEDLYAQFKSYRQQINTASRIEELTPYFSREFLQYYDLRLAGADNELEKRRNLTQFWDNLNTGRDIIIIFDYSVQCVHTKAILSLVAALESNQHRESTTVQLWHVRISYMMDDSLWKINAFEYETLNNGKSYLATDIKDNFVMIH